MSYRERTIKAFHNLITENANRNWLNSMNMKSATYLKLDKQKVALICGAGPSLEEHLPFIEEHRDKLCVICTDNALNRMPNITPDVTINLDPEGNLLQFEKTRGPLMAPTYAHPELLRQWDDIYFFNARDDDNPTLCATEKMFGPRFIAVNAKSNVGHFAVHVAFRYGFDHIAFTGIDYTYDDKGIAYFYAASFMDHVARYYSERNLYHLGRGILPLEYELDKLKEHLNVSRTES